MELMILTVGVRRVEYEISCVAVGNEGVLVFVLNGLEEVRSSCPRHGDQRGEEEAVRHLLAVLGATAAGFVR